MEHTTYASRLRYLAAADVDDTVVDYDGLDVEGPDGGRIGDVSGFIVDAQAARLHYVVVDSGGWFRSRRFLLPIGHANLSGNRAALRVDVTRDALSGYPAFDANHFSEFSDDDLTIFEQRMASVCCPDESVDKQYGLQRHYTQPDWWTTSAYAHERLRPVELAYTDAAPRSIRERFGAEQTRADAADMPAGDSSIPRRVAERVPYDDEDEPRQSDR